MSSLLVDARPAHRPAAGRHLPPLVQFPLGLAVVAMGVWLSVRVGLGLSPWDVLHFGLAQQTGASFGTVLLVVGAAVLALATLLGVRPSRGTVVNIVLMAVVLDRLIASPWLEFVGTEPLPARVAWLVAAVLLIGFGAAVYIGAGLGAGPRDSLMVAAAMRGLPVGPSRVVLEGSVLLVGWLLGGTVGIGTVLLTVGVGPAAQLAFRVLHQQPTAGQRD